MYYCTSIANGYYFLQNFLLGPTPHGFYYDIIGRSGCQSNQCGAVGSARQTHLYIQRRRRLINGLYISSSKCVCVCE